MLQHVAGGGEKGLAGASDEVHVRRDFVTETNRQCLKSRSTNSTGWSSDMDCKR